MHPRTQEIYYRWWQDRPRRRCEGGRCLQKRFTRNVVDAPHLTNVVATTQIELLHFLSAQTLLESQVVHLAGRETRIA